MKDHMSDPLVKEDAGERTLLLAVSEEVKQKVRTEFGDEFADSMQVLNTFVGVPQEIFNPWRFSGRLWAVFYRTGDIDFKAGSTAQ